MNKTLTYKPRVRRLELEDYPEAIAEVRAAIARCDQRIAELDDHIETRKARFDREVARNSELRNDSQRKAAWKEAAYNDSQYRGWQALRQNQEQQRHQHEIKLELLRGCFTVAKLRERQAIATTLATLEGGLDLVA